MNRRTFLKSSVEALTITFTGTSSVKANDNQNNSRSDQGSGHVLYADEHGRIERIGRYSYGIAGAKTEEDFEFLRNKRIEILHESKDEGVSAHSHTDSGSDYDNGYYQGEQWSVSTDFWAQAEDSEGECEGTASAAWYGDEYWVDDPIEVDEIEISSELRAGVEDISEATVTFPPAYTYNERELSVTLTDSFYDSTTPSLHHSSGAVTFYAGDGGCFNWIQQDDRFKFVYETGDTEFYGTYVRADVGHCWY